MLLSTYFSQCCMDFVNSELLSFLVQHSHDYLLVPQQKSTILAEKSGAFLQIGFFEKILSLQISWKNKKRRKWHSLCILIMISAAIWIEKFKLKD